MASARPVLLVEDDFDIRDSISDVLADEGHEVVCASDGREALALLEAGLRPRVILLDLMMAGMNGMQFRSEQQRRPELASIPVVVLTADRHVDQRARELAADAYLRKPTHVDELLEVLSAFQ